MLLCAGASFFIVGWFLRKRSRPMISKKHRIGNFVGGVFFLSVSTNPDIS